jgi:hypothetical protein
LLHFTSPSSSLLSFFLLTVFSLSIQEDPLQQTATNLQRVPIPESLKRMEDSRLFASQGELWIPSQSPVDGTLVEELAGRCATQLMAVLQACAKSTHLLPSSAL